MRDSVLIEHDFLSGSSWTVMLTKVLDNRLFLFLAACLPWLIQWWCEKRFCRPCGTWEFVECALMIDGFLFYSIFFTILEENLFGGIVTLSVCRFHNLTQINDLQFFYTHSNLLTKINFHETAKKKVLINSYVCQLLIDISQPKCWVTFSYNFFLLLLLILELVRGNVHSIYHK